MSLSSLRPRRAPRWVRILLTLQVAFATAYALLLVEADAPLGLDLSPDSWWPLGVFGLVGSLSCAAAAAQRPGERIAWAVLAIGSAGWVWGFLSWAALHEGDAAPPYPSISDAGWLIFPSLMAAALILLLRGERPRLDPHAWLDAAIPAFAVSALASQLLLPVVSTSGEDLFGKIILLAYPGLDIALIALVMLALALRRWEPGPRWELLVVAVLAVALGDAIWAVLVAAGEHQPGGVADLPWIVTAVTVAMAPWAPAPRHVESEEDALTVTLPAVAALGALGLLFYGAITGDLVVPALVLAVVAAGSGVARWSLALRQEAHAAVLREVAEELSHKAEQQAAVADLGRRAISSPNTDEMMRRAAAVVAGILDAERVAVLERSGPRELVAHADTGAAREDVGELHELALAALDAGTPTVQTDDALCARIERKDGSWGLIAVLHEHAAALAEDDVSFVQAVANVLGAVVARTREEQLESQLQQARRLESVGKLAGGVAHDFNNLLAIIQGYADFAREASTDDEQRRDLEELSKAAKRGAELVRQLLQFSRRRTAEAVTLDPAEVIRDTEPMLRRAVGERVRLRCWLASELPPTVIEPGQITQVLVNLAVNARDAMPEGGTLTITATQAGDTVRLVVEDTGAGMDEETVARAFDPFFTTKPPGSGTGLGLASVYGIVKQSDGAIAIDSKPGRGTRVVIELPCGDAALAPRPAPEPPAPGPGRGETILVVEDDPSVRGVATRILRAHGYEVLEAAGGQEALRVAETARRPIDLLVSDVSMPGMSGPELADRLRAALPGLPVLHMSGYADGVGTDGITALPELIQKPFEAVDLLARVRTLLGEAEVGAPVA